MNLLQQTTSGPTAKLIQSLIKNYEHLSELSYAYNVITTHGLEDDLTVLDLTIYNDQNILYNDTYELPNFNEVIEEATEIAIQEDMLRIREMSADDVIRSYYELQHEIIDEAVDQLHLRFMQDLFFKWFKKTSFVPECASEDKSTPEKYVDVYPMNGQPTGTVTFHNNFHNEPAFKLTFKDHHFYS